MIQNLVALLITAQQKSSIDSTDVLTLPSGITSFFKILVHCVEQSGPFGKFILIVLLCFSIGSWAIMAERWLFFRKLKKTSKRFLEDIWSSQKLSLETARWPTYNKSPLAHLYRSACLFIDSHRPKNPPSPGQPTSTPAMNVQLIERSLDRTVAEQITYMEKYLPFLATTASATPFIGLLGTVWGILATFYQMGLSGSANFTTIAPGLAEALIATAAGLAAAIPAVIAYNHFTTEIRRMTSQMYQFSSELLNHIEQNYS